jgi:hypothetical protein
MSTVLVLWSAGELNVTADNTGFMFDIAPSFNALLIFGEHRFVLFVVLNSILMAMP